MTERDIKFRAWNSMENKYVPDGYMWCAYTGKDQQQDDFPIEQYTGLKDVNGVEIYEYDILDDVKFPLRFKVIYEEDMAAFILEPIGDFDEWKSFSDTSPYHYEVIGNTHENPELLGDLHAK